jgi:hypothetical protein
MDIFYIIVLGVAVSLLIIVLAIIGVGMSRKSGKSTPWPPVESTCPDYWKIDPTTRKCILPKKGTRNAGGLYNNNGTVVNEVTLISGYDLSGPSIDFTTPYWIACNKQNWAKTYNVYWDGYSNYNGCLAST